MRRAQDKSDTPIEIRGDRGRRRIHTVQYTTVEAGRAVSSPSLRCKGGGVREGGRGEEDDGAVFNWWYCTVGIVSRHQGQSLIFGGRGKQGSKEGKQSGPHRGGGGCSLVGRPCSQRLVPRNHGDRGELRYFHACEEKVYMWTAKAAVSGNHYYTLLYYMFPLLFPGNGGGARARVGGGGVACSARFGYRCQAAKNKNKKERNKKTKKIMLPIGTAYTDDGSLHRGFVVFSSLQYERLHPSRPVESKPTHGKHY